MVVGGSGMPAQHKAESRPQPHACLVHLQQCSRVALEGAAGDEVGLQRPHLRVRRSANERRAWVVHELFQGSQITGPPWH